MPDQPKPDARKPPMSRAPHTPRKSPFVEGNPLDSPFKTVFLKALGLTMATARRPQR